MKVFGRSALLFLLLAATAGCDRVTKHLAMTTLAGMPGQSFLGDTIRLDYHENPGGFLSTGATWRPEIRAIVFQFLNAVVLTAAGFLALRHQWSRWAKTGLAMFLAGGVSNLVDRVATGRVIDFLNVGIGPFRTGIFNVADIAIVVGIALLLVEHWRRPATV
jgi:signal peptidase II